MLNQFMKKYKQFKCKICEYKPSKNSNMKRHYKSVHEKKAFKM